MSSKTPNTTVISLRVPIEQREAIEKAAVGAGASVSGFIATTMAEALSGKPRPSRTAAAPQQEALPQAAGISLSDPAAIAELKRIGININQLAHAANGGLPPKPAEIVRAFAKLFAVLSEPDAFKARLETVAAAFEAPEPPRAATASVTAAPQATRPLPQPRPVPSRPAPVPARPVRTAEPKPVPTARPRPAVAPKAFDPDTPSLAPEPLSPLAPIRIKPKVTTHDPTHPRARNELQERPHLYPARPAEGDDRSGRLGLLGKLWKR